jgi:hypothetical protein
MAVSKTKGSTNTITNGSSKASIISAKIDNLGNPFKEELTRISAQAFRLLEQYEG